MKPKPYVGQRLFSLNIGNAARWCEQKLTPVEVTKVGRKYFSVKKEGWRRETQYHIDNWYEVTNYSADSCLYETEQEWIDEKKATELLDKIQKIFHYSNGEYRKLSLEQLRKIWDVIEYGHTEEEGDLSDEVDRLNRGEDR